MKNINNINRDRKVFSYTEIENCDYYVDWGADYGSGRDTTVFAPIQRNKEKESVIDLSDLTNTFLLILIIFFILILLCGREIAEILMN